ncbi:hypothetical protein DFH09DRAFT_1329210 [Mycena vulgaris]|nr:hypothetical protein DFH09DRAFT_1329210 [Mycena vulgaris]
MSKQSSQPLLQGAPTGGGLPQYSYRPVSYKVHPVSYQAVSYQPIALPLRTECRRSLVRRFIVAFLVAVGIFAALKVVVRHHKHAARHRWNIPANMILDRCERGSAWAVSDVALLDPAAGPFQHAAETSFEIPLAAGIVLVLARYTKASYFFGGTPLSGSLDITNFPRLNHTTARVVVSSTYGRSSIKACLMRGEDGEAGVGIFVHAAGLLRSQEFRENPAHTSAGDATPANKRARRRPPHFSVNVGDLKDAVEFASVKLRTSNAASLSARDAELRTSNSAISVDSLIGSSLTLATSSAGISGAFCTTGSLYMATSNAPINVSVRLESLNSTRPTTLHMRTSNNLLAAHVSLAVPAESEPESESESESEGGRFGVVGTTSNGRLVIGFPSAPRGAALEFTARTSNAKAEVALPRAYEGTFALATSGYSASVLRDGDERWGEDKRQIEYEPGRSSGRAVRGYIYKDAENKERGRVGVTTSNAPVVLIV